MRHRHHFGWDGPTLGPQPNVRIPSARHSQLDEAVWAAGKHRTDVPGTFAMLVTGTPHPFLVVKRVDTPDANAEWKTASRKSSNEPAVLNGQFMTWPGFSRYTYKKKAHFKPTITCAAEARGEMPVNARLLVGPGSRPAFPTFSLTARAGPGSSGLTAGLTTARA
mmetsp:Transcript_64461/g.171890  ORF Transcript_64461/g.171890 Transcript_64461/m.171890 type:complete len:165 (-) Transcript_64461:524-1018(-)